MNVATARDGAAATGQRHDPSEVTHALLEEARAEQQRAAERERRSPLLSVPESQRLAMIVAVREAAAAGLTDAAIDTCVATIRPTLLAMNGSDYFVVGPRSDLAAIERHLRQGEPERAVALIRDLSRMRWWASVAFLALLALVFWLWRR